MDDARGSYWKDPKKAAQATEAMQKAWADRRFFIVSWEDGREVISTSLEEVSLLVRKSTPTLRIYLARNKGTAKFVHDGELITLRRVYR